MPKTVNGFKCVLNTPLSIFTSKRYLKSGSPLRAKCPYSEFFWSVVSPNAGKYGPEKLRIRTPLIQCSPSKKVGFTSFIERHLKLMKMLFISCKCGTTSRYPAPPVLLVPPVPPAPLVPLGPYDSWDQLKSVFLHGFWPVVLLLTWMYKSYKSILLLLRRFKIHVWSCQMEKMLHYIHTKFRYRRVCETNFTRAY